MSKEVYDEIVGLIDASLDDKALAILDNFLKENPNDTRALCLKGDIAFLNEEYQDALDLYNKAFQNDISCFDAAKGIASSLFFMDNIYNAIEMYEKAIDLNRSDASLLHQYGKCLMQIGHFEKAVTSFDIALSLDYKDIEDLISDKMEALLKYGKNDEIEVAFSYALAKLPNCQVILCSYANFLWKNMKNIDKSFECFISAIGINSEEKYPSIYLFDMIYKLSFNSYDKAKELSFKWYTLYKDNPLAKHSYQSITKSEISDKADEKYIEDLFDNFSETFDNVLAKLGYDTPERIGDILENRYQEYKGKMDILDAGCGTGRCGKYLEPFAKRKGLTGIDLSQGMLDKADEKKIYDYLVKSDLIKFMSNIKNSFDLIVSTDVLIYIGDVIPVFNGAFNSLRKGGIFVFSVSEASTDDNYELNNSGRYFHNVEYIKKSLIEAKFSIEYMEKGTLRMEFGKPERGVIFVAKKPDSIFRSFL